MSATAPIVQKCVRCAIAPNTAASTKAQISTCQISACMSGAAGFTIARYFNAAMRSRAACAASDFG